MFEKMSRKPEKESRERKKAKEEKGSQIEPCIDDIGKEDKEAENVENERRLVQRS